jgi:hypothetical protein
VDADNPAWVLPEPGAVRALPVALKLMDEAGAWKHDKDLSDRLTDQAASLLGHDAVVTIIGLQNAGKLANCGTPAWERFTGLAEAGDVEIAAVILSRDHEYVCEDRGARRVREDPAARPADPVNLGGEMRAKGLIAGGLTDGGHDHQ